MKKVQLHCPMSVRCLTATGCLLLCISLFLTACGDGMFGSNGVADKDGLSGSDSAVGDGRGAESQEGENQEAGRYESGAQEKEWVYVPEMIMVEDPRADYGEMQLVGDALCYISMTGETEEEAQKICRYSLTDRELVRLDIQWPPEEKKLEICSYIFEPDYGVWLIVNAYSADYGQLKRYLCRFDSEGKNLVYQDVTEEMGRGSYVGDMALDGQGRIYVFTSEHAPGEEAGVWLYTEEGSYQGELSFGASETVVVRGTANGEADRLYVCISKGESPDHCTVWEADFQEKKLTKAIDDFPNINGLCMGDFAGVAGQSAGAMEQHTLLLYDDRYVYGYNFSVHENGFGQTLEELFAWTDSDINGYFVESMGVLEDGGYYAAVEDWENNDRCIVILRKTKAAEAAQKKNITLAAVNGGSSLTALAVKFNRSQVQYHLDLKNYDSLTDLYNAILTREPIDLIDLSGVNIESLLRQGILEDLRPWMEQSEAFAPSDFLEGILDTYTVDGVLAGIPQTFSLRTMVGKKTLADESALTPERLFAAAQDSPGAVPVGATTRDEMMQYLMTFNQDAFIDWETGECRFDSEQFEAVLEFVSRFPDSLESEKEEEYLPGRIQSGEVLYAIVDIYNLKSLQVYQEMFGKEVSLGFPAIDGQGGTLLFPKNAFGITSVSQQKEGAWAFLESVLGAEEEIYNLRWMFGEFPSLKKHMDTIASNEIEEDRKWAEEGYEFGARIFEDGTIIQFHAVTREEIDTVLGLVKHARPCFSVQEDQVLRIIGEEAAAYYSGQKGAGDVMRIIQNRVQLYVNESR